MGVELTDPPSDSSDADFDELLVASASQALEVEALAEAHSEKDSTAAIRTMPRICSTEIALSPWFRAESVTVDDETRFARPRSATQASREAADSRRSSLAKTDAITGYVWGRRFQQPFERGEPRSRLARSPGI